MNCITLTDASMLGILSNPTGDVAWWFRSSIEVHVVTVQSIEFLLLSSSSEQLSVVYLPTLGRYRNAGSYRWWYLPKEELNIVKSTSLSQHSIQTSLKISELKNAINGS